MTTKRAPLLSIGLFSDAHAAEGSQGERFCGDSLAKVVLGKNTGNDIGCAAVNPTSNG